MSPTYTYTSLQAAYDYFNKSLFNGTLPTCLITMQRKSKANGYFYPSRFENKSNNQEVSHEIALNPSTFSKRSDTEILSTLVHEMVHLWQQESGKPSRSGYHNKQWSKQMLAIGLVPSNTGVAGGKQTGQKMTHYIQTGGKFEQAIDSFLSNGNTTLLYQDRLQDLEKKKKKAASKTKYTCLGCAMNVWGKEGLAVRCDTDDELLIEDN